MEPPRGERVLTIAYRSTRSKRAEEEDEDEEEEEDEDPRAHRPSNTEVQEDDDEDQYDDEEDKDEEEDQARSSVTSSSTLKVLTYDELDDGQRNYLDCAGRIGLVIITAAPAPEEGYYLECKQDFLTRTKNKTFEHIPAQPTLSMGGEFVSWSCDNRSIEIR